MSISNCHPEARAENPQVSSDSRLPFILDTNVVSELVNADPEPAVDEWVARRDETQLYLTTITEAELRFGLVNMPNGQRKDAFADALGRILLDFSDRILPFDRTAAKDYALIRYAQQRAGIQVKEPDRIIASIAKSAGAAVVTRNVRDFQECGVEVINPWEHSP